MHGATIDSEHESRDDGTPREATAARMAGRSKFDSATAAAHELTGQAPVSRLSEHTRTP